MESTNNTAARASRPAVFLQSCSQGPQSERGGLFVERMQAVASTLRQQERAAFDYLHAATRADRAGNPPPALLPPHL